MIDRLQLSDVDFFSLLLISNNELKTRNKIYRFICYVLYVLFSFSQKINELIERITISRHSIAFLELFGRR